MKAYQSFFFVVLILFCACAKKAPETGIEFVNGNWFNGINFVDKVVYVSEGRITEITPVRIDTTIDLKDEFVIPPFGEAHSHNLDREWQLAFLPKQYLAEGTFYVQCLTCKAEGAKITRKHFESDSTIDVKFAQQGITSTLGHPFLAYEPFEMGLRFDDWEENMDRIKESRLDENNGYIFIDSVSQIDKRLKFFFDAKPDMAKIYLLDAVNHGANSKTEVAGLHGLSPEIAKIVVSKLDSAGLTVYAHIETVEDFNLGIDIGVDIFAHMPGYNWDGNKEDEQRYVVNESQIKRAVDNNVYLIPDAAISLGRNSVDSLKKVNYIKRLIRTYYDLGGKVLAGTDMFNMTLMPEIDALISLNIFTNQELLTILTKDTPKAIYPDRKIGEFKNGFEASFIVLNGNPLEEIENLKNISLKVKQGLILD